MPRLTHSFALAFALLTTSCSATATDQATQTQSVEAKPVAVDLQKGQVVSYVLINAIETDQARQIRQDYYSHAFPIASEFGFKREADLSVRNTYVGAMPRDAAILFSYPDAAAEAGLMDHPDWPGIRDMRPQAWDELVILTGVLETPLSFSFDPDKAYTLAVAEINPSAPDAYNSYMAGIEAGLNDMGGRFIHRLINPKIESHGYQYDTDVQVTLVEWDDASTIARYTRTDTYSENADYFTEGVIGFEFFEIAPVTLTS